MMTSIDDQTVLDWIISFTASVEEDLRVTEDMKDLNRLHPILPICPAWGYGRAYLMYRRISCPIPHRFTPVDYAYLLDRGGFIALETTPFVFQSPSDGFLRDVLDRHDPSFIPWMIRQRDNGSRTHE